jgi:hypothetical protein
MMMQLPIDECEEWIWQSLNCTKDCSFEYVKDENKEFLIFITNDFFADAKAIEKIRKTTGMGLVHQQGYSQLWFGRYNDSEFQEIYRYTQIEYVNECLCFFFCHFNIQRSLSIIC